MLLRPARPTTPAEWNTSPHHVGNPRWNRHVSASSTPSRASLDRVAASLVVSVAATCSRKGLQFCRSRSSTSGLGGACHTFTEKVADIGEFHFESGPSLYSGLSLEASPSQLKHVFQIIGKEPEWITYDRWNAFLPEGEVNVAVGYKEVVKKLLPRFGGPDAVSQWQELMAELKPMSEALYNSPPFGALRDDPFAPITLGRYTRRLLPLLFGIPGGAARLSQPFEAFLNEAGVTDDFVRNYLSLFSFLLQGLPSYGSPTSMMAYMMADLYRKGGTCLDYPKGGSESIVQALVDGIKETSPSGKVLTKAHVEEILVENGRASGVRLRNGSKIRAREAVVCGTDIGVAKGLVKAEVPELASFFEEQWSSFEPLKSFIHVHMAFRGQGLPRRHCPEFPAQWGVVNHWADLEAPRNCVLVSVPSLLDTFAPEGYHSLHAYTPATEPWEDWQGLSPEQYQQKKKEAGDFLISAIERQELSRPGSRPSLGHRLAPRRFLRKPKGAYGWRVVPSVSQKAFSVARCYREWRPLSSERREISDSPSIAERAASRRAAEFACSEGACRLQPSRAHDTPSRTGTFGHQSSAPAASFFRISESFQDCTSAETPPILESEFPPQP
ncbi:CRTISO [Symbiodinium necroappetens]|uniref:CRTISO protein n=1 Tax=Symbiodinium necroappetens TaxID=1628268 RepID=A0A812LYZ0_9DINO|nr:CRTISO [Symbiodinium necroappetens]